MRGLLLALPLLALATGLPAGAADCNGNSIPDDVEIAHGAADCNANDVLDECDIDEGTSTDCDANTVPDECDTQLGFTDETVGDEKAPFSIAADLDGDGDGDVVVSDWDNDRVVWYENLGDGSFGSQQVLGSTFPSPGWLVAADLDGDTDPDIVLAPFPTDIRVGWFENLDGTDAFGPLQLILDLGPIGGAGMYTLLALDLDGDADVDVLASYNGIAGPEAIVLLENTDGQGSFAPAQVIWSQGEPWQGAAGDLDGDADADLVWAFDSGHAWLENLDGAGSFGAPVFFSPLLPNVRVRLGDLDGDADLDVLAEMADGLGWFENLDGAATFGPLRTIHEGDSGHLTTVDLDGDADLDVVWVGSFEGAPLAWHENLDGAGTFSAAQTLAGITAHSVFAFDADADLDTDLLVSKALEPHRIALFRNGSDDCNANQLPDVCDLASGASEDCNATGLPDECESVCRVDCDVDLDGCAADLDCDPTDAGVWSDPAVIDSLVLGISGGAVELSWGASAHPGATSVVHDTLRSTAPGDFHGAADCLESDDADTVATDADALLSGEGFFYLIRVENGCPGGTGAMGASSDGSPRTGADCP